MVEDTRELSRRRVHHAYTAFHGFDALFPDAYPRVIVRGEGAYLYSADGLRVLDAGLHLGACQIGHGSAEVADRVAEQIRTLEFASFDEGHTHPWAPALAERLAGMVAVDDPLCYFTSSGSEAIEVAIKIARLVHAREGARARTKIVARAGGFHGVTLGALSAMGNPALREPFGPLVPGFVRAAEPLPGRCGLCPAGGPCSLDCADDIERTLLREDPQSVAALIAEPIGIHGGVKAPPRAYWERVRAICDRHDVLLIVDEVVTGFGRTGAMFAGEHYGLRPDIVVVAKGLTSGYVPMGAAIVSRRIADAFAAEPLLHNNTFAGHPVACAAAQANLDIIERDGLVTRAADQEALVRERVRALANRHSQVRSSTVRGLLASIAVRADGVDADRFAKHVRHSAFDAGVMMRCSPHGADVNVFFMPPLVVGPDDIDLAFDVLAEAIRAGLDGAGAGAL